MTGQFTQLDPRLLAVLTQLEQEDGLPIHVNSGFRDPARNKAVGGVSNSEHTDQPATGADIQCLQSTTRFKLVTAALKRGITRIGIGKTFVHIGMSTTRPASVMWHYYPAFIVAWFLAVSSCVWSTPTPAAAQMDTLEAMERDFLRLSEPCQAEDAWETRISGIEYRVRSYRCGAKKWRLWQYRCEEGYWSRLILMDQADRNEDAYYMDRFGGLHNGKSGELVEAYRPQCGT